MIEIISNYLHPKIMLASRYVTFNRSLLTRALCQVTGQAIWNRPKNSVGRTLDTLCGLCDSDDATLLTSTCVKSKMSYFSIPEVEQWRVNIVTELLQLKDHKLSLPGFSEDEIEAMYLLEPQDNST